MNYSSSKDRKSQLVARDIQSFGTKVVKFMFDGEVVCKNCYMMLHNVTHHDITEARSLLKDDTKFFAEDEFCLSQSTNRPAKKLDFAQNYIREWFLKHCGYASRDNVKNNLPFPPIIAVVYEEFLKDCPSEMKCSLEWFRQAFQKERMNWKTPRHSREIKACSHCYRYCAKLLQLRQRGDIEMYEKTKKEMREHQEIAYKERLAYYEDRESAKREEIVGLIVDFTNPLYFPFLPYRTALKDGLEKLPVGFGSIIDHCPKTDGGGSHFYFLHAMANHDNANSVCCLIFHHLERRKRKNFLLQEKELRIQLDSSSTNKSKLVLKFLSWCIARYKLSSVLMSFLVVGHTGEDVDGVTSAVRNHIRNCGNVFSPDTFFHEKHGSYEEYHCMDFLTTDGEKQIGSRAYSHFLMDFEGMFEKCQLGVGGFTGKTASRTEHSVHCIELSMGNDLNPRIRVKVLRNDPTEIKFSAKKSRKFFLMSSVSIALLISVLLFLYGRVI